MVERLLVVGDIHGCAEQLRILLQQPSAIAERKLIFLGDYVDVGPDSKAVVELLLEVKEAKPETVFLQGNHDAALVNFLENGDFSAYAALGGIRTIRSYAGEVFGDVRAVFERSVSVPHRAFFDGLVTYAESDRYLFSHCGYSPDKPLDRTVENMVMRSHQRLFTDRPTLGKLAVCGHYFQRTHVPFVGDQVICLDTGCGILDGPLTALKLPDFEVVQVSAELRLSSWEVDCKRRLIG